MAKCEVCGVEQYPYNTRVAHDRAGNRHFFCSNEHLRSWAGSPAPETGQFEGQITVEEVVEEMTEEEVTFHCHLCPFEAKTEAGLAAHKRAKHKK